VNRVAVMSSAALITTMVATAAPVVVTAGPAAAGESVVTAEARKYPIVKKHVQRYRLKGWELKQIKAAKRWATTSKARQVRQCESGDRYGISTGNGYYGAWQFAAGTWRGAGGGRYSSYAHQAPKFAQDHIAWKLWQRSGWGPWGCA
jgi:hypothetical protein